MTNDLILGTDDQALALDRDPLEAFDHAAIRFLETRKSRSTQKSYERTLREYRALAGELGGNPLLADCLIAYNSQINKRRRDNGGDLANDTIRRKLKTLQSFFSWCWGYDLTPLKPRQVRGLLTIPPARKLSPRDILTEDEAAAILQAARFSRDRRRNTCLIRVMLDAGLRVSEALGLKARDVYSAHNRYFLHVTRGKGDKERDIEIPPDLYSDLADYAAQEGVNITDPKQGERILFALDRSNVWRMLERCGDLADIQKRITPHCLRHTHAHHLRLQDLPLEVIAARMGHESLDTTKIYTRPAELARQIPLPVMPWNNKGE